MDYVLNIVSNVKYLYDSINLLSGAIDVIVVEHLDGSYHCTPFHVRFGKYGVFNFENKMVDIQVNGTEVEVKMKLDRNGVAFFVEPNISGEQLPRHLAASPLHSPMRSNASSPTSSSALTDSTQSSNTMRNISDKSVHKQLKELKRNWAKLLKRCHAPDKRKKKMKHHQKSLFRRGERFFGSYSESEVYRRRKKRIRMQCDAEWNWGKFPKRKKPPGKFIKQQLDSKRTECNNAYIWSWLTWSKVDEAKDDMRTSTADAITTAKDPAPCSVAVISTSNCGSSSTKSDTSTNNSSASTNVAASLLTSRQPSDTKNEIGEDRLALVISSSSPKSKTDKDGRSKSDDHSELLSKPSDAETADNTAAISLLRAKLDSECVGRRPRSRRSLGERSGRRRKRYGSRSTVSSPTGSIASDVDLSSQDKQHLVSSKYKRTLRLSSENLQSLGLHYGSNDARFSITTKFQGTAWCACHIYLYKWSDELVVSDIDGTITKSDVLGHVIPAVGGTWAHNGVADLYTHIVSNGYQMVYLSSRTILMSESTKSYLKTLRQGTRTLPDGPVLLSPASVLMAFRKEVIERRPDEFKILCLTDLKNLFLDRQPFFAGLGNRPTDVASYRAVDIPPERILIINPAGVVTLAIGPHFTTDYSAMASDGSVDYFFPPLFVSRFAQLTRSAVPYTLPEDRFFGLPTSSWSCRNAQELNSNAFFSRLVNRTQVAAYAKHCAAMKERREKERTAGNK